MDPLPLPFIYVEASLCGKPLLCVDICNYRAQEYTVLLCEDGAKLVGRWLKEKGHVRWAYSSSVDFPQDYDVDLDLRSIIETAYKEQK